tara:strand:+ start:1226 stop:1444 length:219 start_codon:yes stop_codon:yes gene_type:complete
MNITKFKSNVTDIDGLFVTMTRQEAMRAISSLAKQLADRDSNSGRTEWLNATIVDGDIKDSNRYFSIAVEKE